MLHCIGTLLNGEENIKQQNVKEKNTTGRSVNSCSNEKKKSVSYSLKHFFFIQIFFFIHFQLFNWFCTESILRIDFSVCALSHRKKNPTLACICDTYKHYIFRVYGLQKKKNFCFCFLSRIHSCFSIRIFKYWCRHLSLLQK